jgi:hypothetical protein
MASLELELTASDHQFIDTVNLSDLQGFQSFVCLNFSISIAL